MYIVQNSGKYITNFFDMVENLSKETQKIQKAVQGVFCFAAFKLVAHSLFSFSERYFSYPYTEIVQRHLTPPALTLLQKICAIPSAFFSPFVFGVCTPACEEVLFREVIQRYLLRDQLAVLLNRVSPNLGNSIDHIAMKAMRVCVTAVIFSLYHLPNAYIMPKDALMFQLFNTAIMGIVFGMTRESLGLFPAVVAHIANNSVAILAYQANAFLQ